MTMTGDFTVLHFAFTTMVFVVQSDGETGCTVEKFLLAMIMTPSWLLKGDWATCAFLKSLAALLVSQVSVTMVMSALVAFMALIRASFLERVFIVAIIQTADY